MLAEKIVVGTTGTLLAGGAILGLLAFATQTPALGITLAVLILLSPVLLLALVVWLKITRRSKKTADLGTIESGGEISRSLLFAALLFVVGIVVLACGLSGSVIVIAGFVLATGCSVVVLLAIFGPFLPRTLVRLRSVAGSRKALNAAVGEFVDGQVEQAADKVSRLRRPCTR